MAGNRKRLRLGFFGTWLFLPPGTHKARHKTAQRFHVEVENRGDIESEDLGEDQAADNRDAKRAADRGARADADGDGEGTHQRGEGSHHDGAEPDEAALKDGLGGRKIVAALGLE